MSKKIKVKAAPGLKVHFPQSVATDTGRRTKVLEGAEVIEIASNMRFVRRRLLVGDLIEPAGDVVESEAKTPAAKTPANTTRTTKEG